MSSLTIIWQLSSAVTCKIAPYKAIEPKYEIRVLPSKQQPRVLGGHTKIATKITGRNWTRKLPHLLEHSQTN